MFCIELVKIAFKQEIYNDLRRCIYILWIQERGYHGENKLMHRNMFAPQQRFNEITLALPGKIWEGYIHSKSKHSLYTNVIECNLFMLLNYLYMTNDHTCTYVLY